MIMDIPVSLTVELRRTKISIRNLLHRPTVPVVELGRVWPASRWTS